MIQVQITDDHRIFVEGLVRIIDESHFAEVVGTAATASACRHMLRERRADVLLLDIHLPDGNGVDLCVELMAKYPDLKILALTSFGELAVIHRMLNSGAMGYVLKNAMSEEMLLGIEAVAAGDQFLCDEVELLLKKQSNIALMLTKKERELLGFICEGYTSTEIADRMFLSVETINSYRKNLLFKLNAKNTAALVKMSIEQRLI